MFLFHTLLYIRIYLPSDYLARALALFFHVCAVYQRSLTSFRCLGHINLSMRPICPTFRFD